MLPYKNDVIGLYIFRITRFCIGYAFKNRSLSKGSNQVNQLMKSSQPQSESTKPQFTKRKYRPLKNSPTICYTPLIPGQRKEGSGSRQNFLRPRSFLREPWQGSRPLSRGNSQKASPGRVS